jgi:hypothetical protein
VAGQELGRRVHDQVRAHLDGRPRSGWSRWRRPAAECLRSRASSPSAGMSRTSTDGIADASRRTGAAFPASSAAARPRDPAQDTNGRAMPKRGRV